MSHKCPAVSDSDNERTVSLANCDEVLNSRDFVGHDCRLLFQSFLSYCVKLNLYYEVVDNTIKNSSIYSLVQMQ